jgi:hypothetical protein
VVDGVAGAGDLSQATWQNDKWALIAPPKASKRTGLRAACNQMDGRG